jgi:L-seryl-tRNA(Ser) seleniumtransferase
MLKKIINVTGTIIHTNLGRSILSKEAIRNVEWACSNYINLEYDIKSGQRGYRDNITEELIKTLTGCEASTVVNNNAAAVLLCLNTLAKGKEVIVSRGELIEIGGSFRIPDVIESSGTILKEVGTTNKTYIKDYHNAINDKTALLLKIHTSNYRIEGSTASPDIKEIVSLGREYNIPVMEDPGSGVLIDLSKYGLPKEPIVRDSIEVGVDVVTFSGDKLLGGPQAGIIAGKQAFIKDIRNNPLMRAVRVGKMTIAALDATLRLYIDGMEANIPSLAYLSRPIEDIQKIANEVSEKIEKILEGIAQITVQDGESQVGSGALPVESILSKHVVIKPLTMSVDKMAELFRLREVPIIGRISDDRFVMDMRTVYYEDVKYILEAADEIV